MHHETRFHDLLGFDAWNPCAAGVGPPQYALRTAGDFANFVREQGRGRAALLCADWLLRDAHAVDGLSFAGALCGTGEPPRDTVFSLFVNEELYCARTTRHKLIRRFAESHFPAVQLFDLERDPLEHRDVAADPPYADTLADMNARFYA